MKLKVRIEKGEIYVCNEVENETFIRAGGTVGKMKEDGRIILYEKYSYISRKERESIVDVESIDIVESDVALKRILTETGVVTGNPLNRHVINDAIIERIMDPDGYIELDNGKWLYNWHGKYEPNITIIMNNPVKIDILDWKEMKPIDLNAEVDGNELKALEGSFRISKKGNPVFDLTRPQEHILLMFHWGGAFDDTRGSTTIPDGDIIWQRYASSNGGGTGYTYMVLPIGYKCKVSEEDI